VSPWPSRKATLWGRTAIAKSMSIVRANGVEGFMRSGRAFKSPLLEVASACSPDSVPRAASIEALPHSPSVGRR